ncbi:MAG: DUF58 domain-containing protein [Planctomycetota bacterium]
MPRAECERAAAALRLALPRGAVRGRSGERLGHGTGASLDLQDLRDYVPGDDLRHLDWRAYGRTDRLQVRLYRNEVAPWVDIVCDHSSSMAVTAAKAQAACDLVHGLCTMSRKAGGKPRVLRAGGGALNPVPEQLAFEGEDAQNLHPEMRLRRLGVRILISDFLRRQDPGPDLVRLSQNTAALYVIQLLDPWELLPDTEGPMELIDAETGGRVHLTLDDKAVATYRQRLERLQAGIRRSVRGAGGLFCTVAAASPDTMFRALLGHGVLEGA